MNKQEEERWWEFPLYILELVVVAIVLTALVLMFMCGLESSFTGQYCSIYETEYHNP